MNIKPYDKTIRDLLGSKRQFLIPRFQREYSWDKKNYQEFFKDMMDNLAISNGKIAANQYFLGTMLFIGNFTEGTDQEIQVVDGQQRLTTITILFSALSDRFIELGETTLSRQIFTYIMTKDDDGKEVRILKVIVKKTGPGLSQAKIATKYGASKVCAPQNMGLYERRSRFLNYTHFKKQNKLSIFCVLHSR